MRNLTPAYRRAAYFIVAGILAVLVAAGLITEAQYDSWIELAERFLPLLGSVALTVAGTKTNYGSDDPTTREDVDAAYQSAQPVTTEPAPLTVEHAEQALAEARANTQPDPQGEAAAAHRETTFRE